MAVEDLVKAGELQQALEILQSQVRASPADPKLRIFLFQLLCVLGEWERASTQLNVVGELDSQAFPMVQTYRETLRCEALREQTFAGAIIPLLLGEPDQWIALWFQALQLPNQGSAQAAELRAEALELAGATTEIPGELDGVKVSWIADADSRIGPFFEAFVNGGYYWVPVNRIESLDIEKPTDLRDLVWSPVTFTWENAGRAVGFMPSRYPLMQAYDGDAQALMCRKTEWLEQSSETYVGLGQRTFFTDTIDVPMLSLQKLSFDHQISTA